MQHQGQLVGHGIRRLARIGLHIEQMIDYVGRLQPLTDHEEDRHDASNLMPQKCLANDLKMAGIVIRWSSSAICSSMACRVDNLGRLDDPLEIVHLLDVHLAHVPKIMPSHHLSQRLLHRLEVQLASDEVISVRAIAAREPSAEFRRHRAPTQDADGGRQHIVEHPDVVEFGDSPTLQLGCIR